MQINFPTVNKMPLDIRNYYLNIYNGTEFQAIGFLSYKLQLRQMRREK